MLFNKFCVGNINASASNAFAHIIYNNCCFGLKKITIIKLSLDFPNHGTSQNKRSWHKADKSNSLSICKKCYNIRPFRAHHCALCGVCIRKMDHHCPWIVNCVGESNQKSFCLLLFYSALSSFLSSLCLYKEFMYIITNQAEINKRVIITTVKEQLLSSLYYTLPILGFVLSVAGLVIMLSLIISQLNWIQFNMTLIESKMYPKKYECPFFENNFPKHFTLLFGKGITMLVPTVVSDNSIYDEEERQSLI